MGAAAARGMIKFQQNMLYKRTMASDCGSAPVEYQKTEECIVCTAGMLELHLEFPDCASLGS